MTAPPDADAKRASDVAAATDRSATGTTPAPVDGADESDELVPLSDDLRRVGTLVGDRYRITELIGTGGMGSVYKAEHIHMKKQVALKVLHREFTVLPEVVARFEREAVAAGRIDHPNVVSARDFGRLDDGAYYLALEYIDGEPLSRVLGRETFTVGRSLHVALQIAEALVAAHAVEVVHRDLKPDNVMLIRPNSGFEWVKVLDFGIAKVSIHERGPSLRPLTRAGSVFGTPEYMSPEQAAGQAVDHRADLYALGLLLFRMLAGHPPFRASELGQVLMMQVTQPTPPLPEGLAQPVAALVEHLLQKQPEARPQSAAAVVTRIAELLESVSVEALGTSVAPPTEPSEEPTPPRDEPSNRSTLGRRLDDSVLGLPIDLGGSPVPLWRLSLVGFVLLALGLGLVALLRSPEPQATLPAADHVTPAPNDRSPAAPTVDPQLDKLLALAFSGDEAALKELEARPAATRTVREWLALGRGRAKLERWPAALEAYERALVGDPNVGQDPALRKDVWLALRDAAATDLALRLAAHHLGPAGADMLYHVWVETKAVTPITQGARKWLQDPEVRAHASPALRFVLDWRQAMSCDDYRTLLPQATLAADARALTLLQRALLKNECELPKEALEAALSACKDRPSPTPY